MWTVVNLVERFSDRYDFFIVARNYDGRNHRTPYTEVKTNEWNRVGPAMVYYVPDSGVTRNNFGKFLNEIRPDAVFLNSFFCTLAIKYLLLRKMNRSFRLPTILAPCGELIPETINLKPVKKKAFIATAKATGLYMDVLWKASFEDEERQIKQVFGEKAKIMKAPDLPPASVLPDFSFDSKPGKESGKVKFSFVSRVSRKKNLAFLLEALGGVTVGDIELDIIGPVEDERYWAECDRLISVLPRNIRVNILGAMENREVLDHLTGAHFFVLPTLGENFGYVFVEAMAAGCPLIISDRTVWNDLEVKGIGWNIPIYGVDAWRRVLADCTEMGEEEYRSMSLSARSFAQQWLTDPSVEAATAAVLETALSNS